MTGFTCSRVGLRVLHYKPLRGRWSYEDWPTNVTLRGGTATRDLLALQSPTTPNICPPRRGRGVRGTLHADSPTVARQKHSSVMGRTSTRNEQLSLFSVPCYPCIPLSLRPWSSRYLHSLRAPANNPATRNTPTTDIQIKVSIPLLIDWERGGGACH